MEENILDSLAFGIINGTVFTSLHVEDKDISLIPTIFGDDDDGNDGLIYGYLCDATGSEIDGYPIFNSCKTISMSDTNQLLDVIRRLLKDKRDYLEFKRKSIEQSSYNKRKN